MSALLLALPETTPTGNFQGNRPIPVDVMKIQKRYQFNIDIGEEKKVS